MHQLQFPVSEEEEEDYARMLLLSASIITLWNGKTTDLKMSCGGNSAEETVRGRAMKPRIVS